MSDKLIVSTPEEYVKLTTRKVRVTSTAVFNIRAMEAGAMVYLLSILPEMGLKDKKALMEFCEAHFVGLVKNAIEPSIVAPKNQHLAFLDVVDLLVELMDLSGFTVEEDESVSDEENSTDA